MPVLRRPLPRFLAWAVVLVAVAVGCGLAGLGWWLIVLIELAAWVLVAVADRLVDGRAGSAVARAAPGDAVRAPQPDSATAVAAEDGRRRLIRPARAGATTSTPQPVNWNVWSLERVARDHPEAEELEYLVSSLRQFADAAGQLPADFDPLVRESFGDLLVG